MSMCNPTPVRDPLPLVECDCEPPNGLFSPEPFVWSRLIAYLPPCLRPLNHHRYPHAFNFPNCRFSWRAPCPRDRRCAKSFVFFSNTLPLSCFSPNSVRFLASTVYIIHHMTFVTTFPRMRIVFAFLLSRRFFQLAQKAFSPSHSPVFGRPIFVFLSPSL